MTRSSPRRLHLAFILALAVLAPPGAEGGAGGQELPWLPRGRVSLDFAPSFWSWDSRFGYRAEQGRIVEEVEPLGWDLTASPLGSAVLPQLGALEAGLAEVMGDPSYRVRLGTSRAVVDQGLLVFPFRLEIGVTDWLTLGAMVPLVRPRTEILFTLDADSLSANVGPSPYVTDLATVARFLVDFGTTLTLAQAAHPGAPAVTAAQAYLTSVSKAYTQSTVFPLSGSAAGLALQARLEEVHAGLAALGFPGAPSTLPLAAEPLDDDSFRSFLAGPAMRAAPLEDWTTPWAVGDAEVTAALRLLSRGFERDSLGNPAALRFQLGLAGMVRLGTGAHDDPNRFLDLSPADGQMDVEGSAFGLLEVGSRLGAWGRVRYGVQGQGELMRRIAAPGEALPNWARLAPLRRTPGNYLEVDLNPRVYLTPALALGARYRFWSKGEDSYALQPLAPEVVEQLDYPPAELLDEETEESLREIGFSATYSSLDAYERGRASIPVHIRATYFRPLSGSGGMTPKGGRFEAGITVYQALWGRTARPPAGTSDPGT
jgi:hypothetical protein